MSVEPIWWFMLVVALLIGALVVLVFSVAGGHDSPAPGDPLNLPGRNSQRRADEEAKRKERSRELFQHGQKAFKEARQKAQAERQRVEDRREAFDSALDVTGRPGSLMGAYASATLSDLRSRGGSSSCDASGSSSDSDSGSSGGSCGGGGGGGD